VVFACIMQLPCKPFPLTGSGRIEAAAVAGTTFALNRADRFTMLRSARGHELA
jgi:predicted oxidoreductase